ncbi:hypothetical protein LIER_22837 [Lithospermum erythrorhizon]|uniref:Uncharacterized protein n=1 Tax=Lithospermum erythrorhizon TaxID=34254 RepID=A0AAV3QYN5_LITER
MIEITSAKQCLEEPVTEFINKWRSLSLKCKDRLSERSAICICIQELIKAVNKGKWSAIYEATPSKVKYEVDKPEELPKVNKEYEYVVTSKSTKFSSKSKKNTGALNLGNKK